MMDMYWILTAATKLFSVMKVTHSRGSVSELRLFTLWSHNKGQSPCPRPQTHINTHKHTGTLPCPLLRAGLASLCDRHSGVMGGPGQAVTGVWKTHAVHPTAASSWGLTCCSRPARLKQHLSERHLAAPGGGARLLLHLLNVGWEHPGGQRGRVGRVKQKKRKKKTE